MSIRTRDKISLRAIISRVVIIFRGVGLPKKFIKKFDKTLHCEIE